MVMLRICLMLMVPTSDVYQQYPLESWLKIEMDKHGVAYIWPNKDTEKGKFGSFFKESTILLKHLLHNVVLVNMDRTIKDKTVAMQQVRENEQFKDLLALMLQGEKVLEPVSIRTIRQTALKYFRPHFSKLEEGKENVFHRCIYPSHSPILDESMVIVDALGYSAMVHMKKRAFRELKQEWEAHIAQLYAKRKPQTQSDYYELLRVGRETFPPNEALENAIREEYQKLHKWLPFELKESNE